VNPAKTDEPIEMPFGRGTHVGPRNRLSDGDTHWRCLANMVE